MMHTHVCVDRQHIARICRYTRGDCNQIVGTPRFNPDRWCTDQQISGHSKGTDFPPNAVAVMAADKIVETRHRNVEAFIFMYNNITFVTPRYRNTFFWSCGSHWKACAIWRIELSSLIWSDAGSKVLSRYIGYVLSKVRHWALSSKVLRSNQFHQTKMTVHNISNIPYHT